MGPTEVLYDPAVHAVHAPTFAPVYPGLHRHLVESVEPLEDWELVGQAMQVLLAAAPSVTEEVLASQFTQELSSEAPGVVRYLPAPQLRQALAAVAPVVVRYFPAPHATHEVSSVKILYFPSTQAVHGPPFDPENPMLQIQATKAILPPGDTEPDGQLVQVPTPVAPTTAEYELVPQSIHILAKEATNVAENLPAPHATQAPCVVAPVVVMYFPAPQSAHAAVPVVNLYFPASHAIHAPPFAPVYPGLHRQLVESVEPLED